MAPLAPLSFRGRMYEHVAPLSSALHLAGTLLFCFGSTSTVQLKACCVTGYTVHLSTSMYLNKNIADVEQKALMQAHLMLGLHLAAFAAYLVLPVSSHPVGSIVQEARLAHAVWFVVVTHLGEAPPLHGALHFAVLLFFESRSMAELFHASKHASAVLAALPAVMPHVVGLRINAMMKAMLPQGNGKASRAGGASEESVSSWLLKYVELFRRRTALIFESQASSELVPSDTPLHSVFLKFADENLEREYRRSRFRARCTWCISTGLGQYTIWVYIALHLRLAMDERNHLYRERYVDSWMASIIAVGLCVLPACCIRWAVSRLEDQERAAKLFGRSLAVLQGVAGLAFIVWTRCCSYGRWPKGLELYAAIGWCIQVLLVRSYGIAHEERLACIASVAAFFIAAPRLTDMTYSEQVGLFWSALLLGEVIGHGFELLERQHYFNTLRTDTHKATAAAPTTDAMVRVDSGGSPLDTQDSCTKARHRSITFGPSVKAPQALIEERTSRLNDLVVSSANQIHSGATPPSPLSASPLLPVTSINPFSGSGSGSGTGTGTGSVSPANGAPARSDVQPLAAAIVGSTEPARSSPLTPFPLLYPWRSGTAIDAQPHSGHSAAAAPLSAPTGPRAPTPALSLELPRRHAPILQPVPLASTALPVHSLFIWCSDPSLEKWISIQIFRENFWLHCSMLLIQICCGFALAAVDPNLGLFTVPVSIICLYKRVRCHAMADLEAAFTSFWWTHVAIEVIISGVTCPASFYYSMADMKRLKEQVEEDRVSASGMTWLFRAGRQATFNTYMKGTPSWVAFLLVIISVLHIVVRSMGMPLSSPRSFALRHTIGLCRFVTEFRVVALLMGQYTMVILSQLGGLAFTHLFELQQRRTTLALLKLSQDITNPTFPATEQEGLRLSKAFQGSVLPISVLRARIDFVDLQIGQVIGSGTFGVVHKGTWFDGAATRGGKRQVAVKTLHRTRLTERDLNAFVRTAEFELRLPPHRNIVRLLGLAWSIDSARISGVYEVCVGGSFSDALGARSRAWTTAQKVGFARQLADGLAFLHEQEPPILHRDLKPENILLDAASGCPTPKIADFGTACQRSSHMTSDISTPLFSAPEILARMPYDASVDVWAFGCCLACLFNNKHSPYVFEASDGVDELYAASARQTDEALRRVSKGLLRPTLADGEHTEEYAAMSTLLDECCAHNSVDRPSSQVLKVKLAAVPISEF